LLTSAPPFCQHCMFPCLPMTALLLPLFPHPALLPCRPSSRTAPHPLQQSWRQQQQRQTPKPSLQMRTERRLCSHWVGSTAPAAARWQLSGVPSCVSAATTVTQCGLTGGSRSRSECCCGVLWCGVVWAEGLVWSRRLLFAVLVFTGESLQLVGGWSLKCL
jgi:hypothetical protein